MAPTLRPIYGHQPIDHPRMLPWAEAAEWLARRECLCKWASDGRPTGEPVRESILYDFYDTTY